MCALSFTCVSPSLGCGSPSSRIPETGQLRKIALTFPSSGLKVYLVRNGDQKGTLAFPCKCSYAYIIIVHKNT